MQFSATESAHGILDVSSGLLTGPMNGATSRLADKMWKMDEAKLIIFLEIRDVDLRKDYQFGIIEYNWMYEQGDLFQILAWKYIVWEVYLAL